MVDLDPRVKPGDDKERKTPGDDKERKTPGDDKERKTPGNDLHGRRAARPNGGSAQFMRCSRDRDAMAGVVNGIVL